MNASAKGLINIEKERYMYMYCIIVYIKDPFFETSQFFFFVHNKGRRYENTLIF